VSAALPGPLLTLRECDALRAARATAAPTLDCTLDLGRSRTRVELGADAWRWHERSYPYPTDARERTVYHWSGAAFEPVARYAGRLLKLVPTEWGAPTFEIDGIKMLPTAQLSPYEDARRKVELVQPRGRRVLDTCGGLGYFAAWCLQGGAARVDGRIVTVPLGWKDRRIDFGSGEKLAMTIPWGDVSTAWHTTGIPNVEVYIPISPGRLRQLRRLERVRPLLGLGPVQRWLKARIDRRPPGPDAAQRARTPTFVWGEARNAGGVVRSARVAVANGDTVPVHASLGVVERLLREPPPPGATTPARLMGRRYVETLPGSGPIVVG
jgi:hypothetical protein